MKKPYIGQTVIFKDGSGNDCPAIVHKVWSDTCVNLTYFSDAGPMVQTSAVNGDLPYNWQELAPQDAQA